MGKGADLIIRIATAGTALAKKQLSGLGTTAKTVGGQMNQLAKIGAIGTAVGMLAVAKGVSKAVGEFVEFEEQLNQSLAIMQTTEAQQQKMIEATRKVAMETRISTTDSAEAYFFLASAGLDAEQSISALPQVARFAQAGMFDMATATDLATDAQSALGLTVSDASANLENLTRVTDVLVKANTLANATVQQFSEALTNKAGSALKVVGKDIEEGVAVLSAFADRGVKGAEAGEKLNQVLRDIPRASAKNSAEFEKLGLQLFDTEGNMKNVADVIEELDSVLAPMSDELKASTLDQLGLNRGVADAVKILSGATGQIREYEQALRDAGGATQEIAENQTKSLQAEIDILSNKFQILAQDIGKDFEGGARAGVRILDKFVSMIIESREAMDELENSMPIRRVQEYNIQVGYTTVKAKRFVEVTRDLSNTHDDARDAIEEYIAGLEDKRVVSEEVTKAVEEENAKEKELAETRQKESLSALENVYDAYKDLQDIQENINNLESKEEKALNELGKEQRAIKGFISRRDFALKKLQEQQQKSLEVTLEEELAIIKANEALEEARENLDGTRQAQIEYELAQQKVNEVVAESTSATREEIDAKREYQRALDELEAQQEKVREAQEKYRKSQEDLAKATERNTENLLEMAIAKRKLDDAIADANAIGALETGLLQMVDLVGGSLDELASKFGNIFSLGGQTLNTDFGQSGGSLVYPNSGGNAMPKDIGGGLAERTLGGGNTIITVNTGAVLGGEQTIEEAVSKALQEGAKRGINVAF